MKEMDAESSVAHVLEGYQPDGLPGTLGGIMA